jgi:N-dimethylarginine dimethylaminohydrolase
MNEYGRLKQVALRGAAEAFRTSSKIAAEWRDLNYHEAPDLEAAKAESAAFAALLAAAGAEIIPLPADDGLTLDAIYVRDSLITSPKGLIKPRMGKVQRRTESDVNGITLQQLGHGLFGAITGSGQAEGGDLVWLDDRTLLVGIGYRTNSEGVLQLQALLGPEIAVMPFDLPHYKGPGDVFHLMSVLSPIDSDLAVMYRPLMPVRLVEFLDQRGLGFVDVPEQEFATMGCNVLAVGPREVLMVEGNAETERRLRAARVSVTTYRGHHISRLGEGGPTCLTRPLVRAS